jgi:PPM family protein phosphatase
MGGRGGATKGAGAGGGGGGVATRPGVEAHAAATVPAAIAPAARATTCRIAAKLLSGVSDVIVGICGCTDVGRVRDHNEDAFAIADLAAEPLSGSGTVHGPIGPRGLVVIVADGMGGAAAGEIASRMAVDIVLDELRAQWGASASADPGTFAELLSAATSIANDRIHRYAIEHPAVRGMGTTATVAGVFGTTLAVAQVGDSRAYLVRNHSARQLTKDQSLLQRLLDAGEITAEQAEQSDRRNIILQALGPEATVAVEVTTQALQRGDALVVCSDGLSGVVRGPEIARCVSEAPDAAIACRQLIATANARGGPDNITAVVARFEGDGLPPPPPRPVVKWPVIVPSRHPVPDPPEGPVARIVRRARRLFEED